MALVYVARISMTSSLRCQDFHGLFSDPSDSFLSFYDLENLSQESGQSFLGPWETVSGVRCAREFRSVVPKLISLPSSLTGPRAGYNPSSLNLPSYPARCFTMLDPYTLQKNPARDARPAVLGIIDIEIFNDSEPKHRFNQAFVGAVGIFTVGLMIQVLVRQIRTMNVKNKKKKIPYP